MKTDRVTIQLAQPELYLIEFLANNEDKMTLGEARRAYQKTHPGVPKFWDWMINLLCRGGILSLDYGGHWNDPVYSIN